MFRGRENVPLPMAECSQTGFGFEGLFSREVIGRFDGGQITSDGGSLLLREVERGTGILRRFAGCFTDHRAGDRIEHSVEELVAQRIYALALGYEDLNDHEQLRADPLLAVLAGKRDPEGKDRKQERDRGKALAGKSTLNRWELTRADAGFCRDDLISWCEAHQVHYVFGLARNQRLRKRIDAEMAQARALHEQTQQAVRVFTEFVYQTHDSWSRARRVVAKAEHLSKGENPRFVVTSLDAAYLPAQPLYEQLYCGRGEMENRIKEQFSLFSDRTSTAYLRSNQLRLYLSSIAYLLLKAFRRWGLNGTAMATAQCQTIRLKLLKMGALVRVTVRKVWVSFSSGYPDQALFARVFSNSTVDTRSRTVV